MGALADLKTALRTFLAPPWAANSNDAADAFGDLLGTKLVLSLGKDGDGTKIVGAVDLAEGTGITITRSGQKLIIASAGGGAHASTHLPGGTDELLKAPKIYYPFQKAGGASGVPGAAGRIRTAGLWYFPPGPIAKFIWYLNDYGTTTERMFHALYTPDGVLVASTGIINPYALASPGGPWNRVFETATDGGTVQWAGGDLVPAWGTKENNASVLCLANGDVPTKANQDRYHGYVTETTATGAPPATITLPPATADTTQGVAAWFAISST